MMKTPTVKCPAAEMVDPVLSSSGPAAQCRVEGGLQPAVGPITGKAAVCCDEYWRCGIWRAHRQIVDASGSSRTMRQQATHGARRHVLS